MPKFVVNYFVSGTAQKTVEAESKQALEARISEEVERDDFEIDVDDFDDVDFTIQEMHPVTRDGREMWTTRVVEGDVRGHVSAVNSSPLFSGLS